MKLSVHFAWTYVIMVGFFWNAEQRVLYFCPLPFVIFKLDFGGRGS